MKPSTLLTTTALTALLSLACTEGSDQYYNQDKADEVSDFEAPEVAGSYGFVVKGVFRLCESVGGSGSNRDECRDMDRRSYFLTMHGLARLSQEESEVDAAYSICQMSLTNVNGNVHSDTDYLKDSLRSFGRVGTFEANLEAGEAGPVLRSDLLALPLGVRLQDPVGEMMPRNEGDTGAFDQDGDGTAGIRLGSWPNYIHLGVRWVADLNLQVAANGVISGVVTKHHTDTVVFDTTGLASSSDIINLFRNYKVVNEAALYEWAVDEGYRVELVPGLTNCNSAEHALSATQWWKDPAERWWD